MKAFRFTHIGLLISMLLILLVSGCSRGRKPVTLVSENRQMVDFSGSWELDYRLSESLEEKFQLQRLIRISELRRQSDTTRRNRPLFSLGNGRSGGLFALLGLGRLAEDISRAPVLEVKQSDADIAIMREDDFPLTCGFYGGAAQPIEEAIGTELCGWDGHQLVFIMDLPDGLNIRHRLTLGPEGEKLNVATTVRSRGNSQPFTLNRVYQRFEPLEDEFECVQTLDNGKTCRRARPK